MGGVSSNASVFRRGWGLAALLLATAALAGLSIQSVYREAQVRKRLVADTHRSIADVLSAQLDAAMGEADRATAAELSVMGTHGEPLLEKIRDIETSRPWLQPLVLAFSSQPNAEPASSTDKRFEELLAAAEEAEYRRQDPVRAASLYAEAANAGDVSRRAAALNGQARTELKAGDTVRAAGTYKKLIVQTEALDQSHARLSAIARNQLVSCYQRLGIKSEIVDAIMDLYAFLISRRFILDEGTYDFYRREVEGRLVSVKAEIDDTKANRLAGLRSRELLLDSIQPSVRWALSDGGKSPAVTMNAIGDSGLKAIHVWSVANIQSLLERSLREPGPWAGVGISLIEDGVESDAVRATLPLTHAPGWRVTAFPKTGSVAALASREVTRFAVLLVLVFGTVVAAMFLAVRSVAGELALARMRADFVASVSHELKTPLSLIRMFAESLQQGWVGEDRKANYYEVITRESERLTGLINNVLDFSRMESGGRKYRRASVDLRGVLASLLDRYQYHLNAAQIALTRELPDEPVFAFVDSEAMEQVFVNLLSNAVKYMGDANRQPRMVRVSLTCNQKHAYIRVADTGIGISHEDRVRIFERFWRADNKHVRAVAGSGLGLTLVKDIIKAHDGDITVESIPGQGSTFAVTLPLVAEERP